MLIKNDFASWKVFYAFSYFEINLTNPLLLKQIIKHNLAAVAITKQQKKAANIVFIVWYALC